MSGFPAGFNICLFYLYLLLLTSTTCLQWMQVYQPSRHRPHSYSWNPTVMWPRKTLSSTDSNMVSLARTLFHERYIQCVAIGAHLLKWLYMCYKLYRKGTVCKHNIWYCNSLFVSVCISSIMVNYTVSFCLILLHVT